MTGLRRDEAPTRANAPIVGVRLGRGIVKVNPIATVDRPRRRRLRSATASSRVHPLADRGYPSIGCWPCTRPVGEGDDPRAGRWAGSGKRSAASTASRTRGRRSGNIVAHAGPRGRRHRVRRRSRGLRAGPPVVPARRGRVARRAPAASRPARGVARRRCGTGKLTRLLDAARARRSSRSSRSTGCARLRRDVLPDVPVVAATAEALPFADASLDAHHGRAGVPLVRRRPVALARVRSACCGPAAGSALDLERARPQRRPGSTSCGRSWTGSRSGRRGATTTTGATPRSSSDPGSAPLHEATFHHEQVLTRDQVVDRFAVREPRRRAARRRAGARARRGPRTCSTRIPRPPAGTTSRSPTGSTRTGASGGDARRPSAVARSTAGPRRRLAVARHRARRGRPRSAGGSCIGDPARRCSTESSAASASRSCPRPTARPPPPACSPRRSPPTGPRSTTQPTGANMPAGHRAGARPRPRRRRGRPRGRRAVAAEGGRPARRRAARARQPHPRPARPLRRGARDRGPVARGRARRIPSSTSIANASDPHVVWAAEPANVTWVALGRRGAATPRPARSAARCSTGRPTGSTARRAASRNPRRRTGSTATTLVLDGERVPLHLALPGTWNRMNAALALAAAVMHFGVDPHGRGAGRSPPSRSSPAGSRAAASPTAAAPACCWPRTRPAGPRCCAGSQAQRHRRRARGQRARGRRPRPVVAVGRALRAAARPARRGQRRARARCRGAASTTAGSTASSSRIRSSRPRACPATTVHIIASYTQFTALYRTVGGDARDVRGARRARVPRAARDLRRPRQRGRARRALPAARHRRRAGRGGRRRRRSPSRSTSTSSAAARTTRR